MSSSKHYLEYPAYVGLKGTRNGYTIITIHKIHYWRIKKGVCYINSHDAMVSSSSKHRVTNEISEYVSLSHLDVESIRKSKRYYAVFKNSNKSCDYTTEYYQCKIAKNEKSRIHKDRKTISVTYTDCSTSNDSDDNDSDDSNDSNSSNNRNNTNFDAIKNKQGYRLHFEFGFQFSDAIGKEYFPSIIDGRKLTRMIFVNDQSLAWF